MLVQSTYKYARISPKKARDVAREIQGLSAADALNALIYTPRKAARMIEKTLKTAMADATHNYQLDPDSLYVLEATATDGPRLKRFTPRAKGSASPILKRSSHINIILIDEMPLQKARVKPSKKSAAITEKKATKQSDQ